MYEKQIEQAKERAIKHLQKHAMVCMDCGAYECASCSVYSLEAIDIALEEFLNLQKAYDNVMLKKTKLKRYVE